MEIFLFPNKESILKLSDERPMSVRNKPPGTTMPETSLFVQQVKRSSMTSWLETSVRPFPNEPRLHFAKHTIGETWLRSLLL